MKICDVLSCSFEKWYKTFEKITIPSVILPVPHNVLNYLQDDGTLVIPEGSELPNDAREGKGIFQDIRDEDDDTATVVAPNLDEFNREIRRVIKTLGGKVFPKLNWSSPQDASWISFNRSLQCLSPGDVYLLLKSSDFVSHDLSNPFKDCSDASSGDCKLDYCLVLRKWVEINPSDEFRCFVKDREIVDAFDVHRPKDGHVILIDFGPFGKTTDSLMFSWEELKNSNVPTIPEGLTDNRMLEENDNEFIEPEFRYIMNATGVQPSLYMQYSLPVDIVDLSFGQDASELVDFFKMKIRNDDEDSSLDEDDRDSSLLESSLSSQSS